MIAVILPEQIVVDIVDAVRHIIHGSVNQTIAVIVCADAVIVCTVIIGSVKNAVAAVIRVIGLVFVIRSAVGRPVLIVMKSRL